ncbi:MAG: SH3 domain-containing protein, partial [Chloroflexota bacterium]|nr:SH3 domain-containing protein [Chloroflexota bacterium]
MQNSIQRRSSPPPAPGSSGINRLVEGPASWLISFLIIPGLLVTALILPPVRLVDRLKVFAYTRIGASGGAIIEADKTQITFPAENMAGFFLASIKSTPRPNFLEGEAGSQLYEAASQMPSDLSPRSPFYRVDSQGTEPTGAILTIPIPNDSKPYETLGLYTWTGSAWVLLPSTVLSELDQIESRLDYVPANFMVMQTLRTVPPSATASTGLQGKLPEGAVVAAEAKPGLYLRGDGALEGTPPAASTGGAPTIAELRNWEGDGTPSNTPRTDLLNNLLLDPGLQQNQLNDVERIVVENNYAGVLIDYRGVDAKPSARADFAHLMTQLAERLHAIQRTVAVRVEPARQLSAEEWDTGGYDWQALGLVVDKVIIPAPDDPRAYRPSGELEAMLRWATSQVERRKLQVELPGQSIERSGNYWLLKGYEEALRPLLGQVKAEMGSDNSQVALTLENPRLKAQVTWDDELGAYQYTYLDDQGLERTVYIENANSLSRKLTLLQKYNVRDVMLRTGSAGDIDPNTWNVLLQFQQGNELSSAGSQLAVAYTVYAADGKVVMSNARPLSDPQLAFAAPTGSGQLRVEAQLVGDRGEALSIPQSTLIGKVSSAVAAAADGQASAKRSVEGVVATSETVAKATATDILNAREGPGTEYPILGQLQLGSTYKIVGKNNTGDWFQIDTGSEKLSWVIGQLVSMAGDTNAIAVIDDLPEPTIGAASAPAAAVSEQNEPTAAESQPATAESQPTADKPADEAIAAPEAPAQVPVAAP